jgi:hypothetical protein
MRVAVADAAVVPTRALGNFADVVVGFDRQEHHVRAGAPTIV